MVGPREVWRAHRRWHRGPVVTARRRIIIATAIAVAVTIAALAALTLIGLENLE